MGGHFTLQSTIGSSHQEDKSYTNTLLLLVGSMVAVLGSFYLEIILFLSYYWYTHLKKALLNQARLLANENHYKLRNLIVFPFIQIDEELELQPIAEEECEGATAEPGKMIGDQEQSEDKEETAV